jgi:WD40 repeat protein
LPEAPGAVGPDYAGPGAPSAAPAPEPMISEPMISGDVGEGPFSGKFGGPGVELKLSLACHASAVWDVRWHGADRLLTASFDGTAELHDVAAARASLLALRGHTDRVMCIRSGPGPHAATTAGRDRVIKRWDLRSGECTLTLADEAEPRFAAQGTTVYPRCDSSPLL